MLVVDASVAFKWVVRETGTEAAATLLHRPLIAPDLLVAEVGGALTKKVRRSEIGVVQARQGLEEVRSRMQFVPSEGLHEAAFDLSLALHHAMYDCYYLALADALDLRMVTADAVFAGKVRQSALAGRVHLLGEEVPGD